MSSIFDKMSEEPIHFVLAIELGKWRDEGIQAGDLTGRKVVCAFAFAGLSLLGIADVIVSLALGILTAPAILGGKQDIPIDFFVRAGVGLICSGLFLTVGQIQNIFLEKMDS